MRLSMVLSTHPAGFEALAYTGRFESNLDGIASLGFDGVELAVRDPKLVDPAATLRALDRHGLVVPAVGTGQAFGEEGLSLTDARREVRQGAVRRLREHLDLARELEALVIIGLIRGRPPPGSDPAQVRRWLEKGLLACCEHAVKRGVSLAIEPINRYETGLINTVGEALELIERAGLENTGVLFDTFHANIEEPSIEQSLRACSGRLSHMHVADSNRRAPGDGHLDFGKIVGVLKETGYRGFLSAEILPLPDPDASARRTYERLEPLVFEEEAGVGRRS